MDKNAVRGSVSLILKIIVAISAVAGTVLSAIAGSRSFMGGGTVFMYFTIQSNIAIAVICAVGAVLLLRKKPVATPWYVVKFVGTVSITLTGLVFCFVLAPTLGNAAWNIQNVLTHVVVPVAAVADFFVTGVWGNIRCRSVFFVILPPLAYAIWAGAGFVLGWQFAPGINYPYFFLNWGSPAGAFGFTKGLPFMGCVWWIIALLILLIALGAAYLAILNAIKKRRMKREQPVIRRFRESDAGSVSELIRRTLKISNSSDYSPECIDELIARHTPDYIRKRADHTHFYVAENSGAVAGCGAIGPYWDSETESCLFTIFVDPECQGRGIGKMIIDALEKDEYFLRAKRVEVPASITALGFYRKLGYDYKDGVTEPDAEGLYRLEKRS
ncbi:MAG: GNAT family N-acetyltransferase [Clostridia bacterium]|nr:GNAT family N-acetyltransferase [Clostridia bacterium]